MNPAISKLATRAKGVGVALILPPLFLILMAIPWLIARATKLLSDYLYAIGWRIPSASCLGISVILMTAVAGCVVWFLIIWLVYLGRIIRGVEIK
jgi:Na+-transporting NADH:ubiquinone oxidoreductase subunit NqrE